MPVAGKKHPTYFGESAVKSIGARRGQKWSPCSLHVMNGESVNTEDSCVF